MARSVADLLQIHGNDKCADCGQNGKYSLLFSPDASSNYDKQLSACVKMEDQKTYR